MSEPTFTDERIAYFLVRYGYAESFTRSDARDFLNAAIAEGLVALPQAKVEDARVQAAIENLKCWAEEWDETGMSHEAALCRQMAETVERLAAERKPEGWRSRTVSDEEWDALVPLAYQHHALDILTLLGLHRSAPKPQDEI